MTFFWICVVIMAFVCIAILLSNNDTIDEDQFETEARLVITGLHFAESFSKDRYWKNNVGFTSVLVLDDFDKSRSYGCPVHPCLMSVLLFDDNIALIKEQSKGKDLADFCHLKSENNLWSYEYEFTFFQGSSKNIAKRLFNKITEEFPNAKCELSGSGVIRIDFV